MLKLESGDKLYMKGNYGIYDCVVINRVTPKKAFAGDLMFEREYENEGDSIRQFGEKKHIGSWYLETKLLKETYEHGLLVEQAQQHIQKWNLKKFDSNQLKLILTIEPNEKS